MTPLDYDPAYSAGVRALLIQTAEPAKKPRRHRIWLGVSLVAGLTILGTGGAIAANYVFPGADIITTLDAPHTLTGRGTATLNLGDAPAGTNSLETSLTCLSLGTLTWPDGSSMRCGAAQDIGSTASGALPWSPDKTAFRLTATPGTRWRLTYTFSSREPTPLKTNATGQTYGIDGDNGHPDLIAAQATNGRIGFINVREEAAAQPCGNPRNPAEAVKCMQDNSGKTFTIPVYESDGTTKIGVFQIGG